MSSGDGKETKKTSGDLTMMIGFHGHVVSCCWFCDGEIDCDMFLLCLLRVWTGEEGRCEQVEDEHQV